MSRNVTVLTTQKKQTLLRSGDTFSFSAANSLVCWADFLTTPSNDLRNKMAALSWESVNTHKRSSRLNCTRDAIMPQSEKHVTLVIKTSSSQLFHFLTVFSVRISIFC